MTTMRMPAEKAALSAFIDAATSDADPCVTSFYSDHGRGFPIAISMRRPPQTYPRLERTSAGTHWSG
jgi:hypothetical protein